MKEETAYDKRVVEIVRSDYQPSKEELEEDMSIESTFEELAKVAVQPVTIRYIPRPKNGK